jgi:prolyl oligopeptidase
MITAHRVFLAVVFAWLLAPLPIGAQDLPLKAAPGNLVTDYQGIQVEDPYRALEDLKSEQTQAWVASNAAFTRSRLDSLPGRKALFDRITALDAERAPAILSLTLTSNGRWFYLKRLGGESAARLCVRANARAPERLLLDPVAWQKQDGQLRSINDFSVAPDGKYVAAIVSLADAELGELQVFDSATGKPVLQPVRGIWGELPAVWSRDGKSMFYAQGAAALASASEPFGKMQIYQRYLDGRPDRKLMGWETPFGPDVRAKDWVFVDPASSREYTFAGRFEGIGSDARVSVARTADLLRDPRSTRWTQVLDTDAHVRDFGAAGRFIYWRTFDQASRYRVLRQDIGRPASRPVEVVPQQDGVIDRVAVAKDGIYVVVRKGSISTMLLLQHGAGPVDAKHVDLPFDGAVTILDAHADVPGIVFSLEGWTHELQVMRAVGTRVTPTDIVKPSPTAIGSDWVSEETNCNGHDGVAVPMSIVYRRGLVKDGSHPALVDGYGGYGLPENAYFNRRMHAWFERGGLFVEVKPRGGGAYGRDWYQSGVGARKSNTWKDMIACAETLIARGYTSRDKIAVHGTSMGGVAAGRAVTERPDLFAVAIIRVGITEAVRFIEATTNGPNHESEMGSVKTEAGVRQLLAMSTYHQIKDGTPYPAVLFTAGMNDNRVAPWIAFKTFARLSAATSSARPVLLRVESAAGHGMSSTAEQRNSEMADRLAFILWNTGDKAFQPEP